MKRLQMLRWLWMSTLLTASVTLVMWQGLNENFEIENERVTTTIDAFGVEQQSVVGTLLNTGSDAYADVQIFAELIDADDEVIGEGFGILVNQCGKNVPLDYALQPDAAQRFAVPLEFYGEETDYDRIDFTPQGVAMPPARQRRTRLPDGIKEISDREIAGMEWVIEQRRLDPDAGAASETENVVTALLYGVGCHRDVFTTYDWHRYELETERDLRVRHPREDEATAPETIERLMLTDPTLYNRSYLSYPPNGGGRLVHQDRINTLITAEADGTFRRIIDEELFRSTLQGIYWLPDERFVAYYYGGYGDGVTYLAASSAGAYFSTPERFSVPSVTVPGATPDLSRFIVGGTYNDDETPGFYLKMPAAVNFERLFEWENLPGNNFPAPVYRSRGGVQVEDVIYFALPEGDPASADADVHLYCYDRREAELTQLAPLPLQLGTEDRATMHLSPDGELIALGANGINGGLWLLDLSAFGACYP